MTDTQYDLVGAMLAFERGTLSDADTYKLFQYLVDTGLAWSLQGTYGRTAEAMIQEGLIQRR